MDLFWIGIGLGLAAGLSPGPLLTLVISSSLDRGFGAGFRVALAPLITDAPIILLAILVLRELPPTWLNIVAALGGCVVIYLGIETLRPRQQAQDEETAGPEPADLARGALVNLLNPHPWVFWATVQGPLLIEGWRRHPAVGIAFVTAFYFAIVGTKVTIAWLVSRGRHRLEDRWHRALLIACGSLLIGMGIILVIQALRGSFTA